MFSWLWRCTLGLRGKLILKAWRTDMRDTPPLAAKDISYKYMYIYIINIFEFSSSHFGLEDRIGHFSCAFEASFRIFHQSSRTSDTQGCGLSAISFSPWTGGSDWSMPARAVVCNCFRLHTTSSCTLSLHLCSFPALFVFFQFSSEHLFVPFRGIFLFFPSIQPDLRHALELD